MTQQSLLHTQPSVSLLRRSQAIVGDDPETLSTRLRPIMYRYVLADVRDGSVIAVLPMTSVSYSVGIYSGQELSGTVYLPQLLIDLMSHHPSYDFEQWTHPDQQGVAVGAMFEIGNTAIYVMRNEEVVWGGVLWSRSYSSGASTMQVTALSWDGYIYYRLLRETLHWGKDTNAYSIWWGLLRAVLTDWKFNVAPFKDTSREKDGDANKSVDVFWTGISRGKHSNAPARPFKEQWPNNTPNIELPSKDLRWRKKNRKGEDVSVKTRQTWHGYDMATVGDTLEQWADTQTIASPTGPDVFTRFEYRVVCWWDPWLRRFRQRYVFGEMTYKQPGDPGYDPKVSSHDPTGISSGLFGQPHSQATKTIFDFPGHISEWSLTEGMENSATRVLAVSNVDAAAKHTAYASDGRMLAEPRKAPASADPANNAIVGSKGWLLYDRVHSSESNTPSVLQQRAERMLELCHVPVAAKIDDIANTNSDAAQRASQRSTDLSITLYVDPTTAFPAWKLGDWVTFAIEDPFYGGKMYLKRRIIGYSVTVVPDHESDYSHEQISLELTDDTKIEESA